MRGKRGREGRGDINPFYANRSLIRHYIACLVNGYVSSNAAGKRPVPRDRGAKVPCEPLLAIGSHGGSPSREISGPFLRDPCRDGLYRARLAEEPATVLAQKPPHFDPPGRFGPALPASELHLYLSLPPAL
jgi:hypothetical protein